jgi:chaperone required for assembly of F1-ATPase
VKRFYAKAEVADVNQGFEVQLDGRPVRTPARNALILPTLALAAASAVEWNGQDGEMDIVAMPMTAFAYAAVDRIGPAMGTFSLEAARFAETDLLCYRAPEPPVLRARQDAAWAPILQWLEQRYGAKLLLAEGIMPIKQPEAALHAVRDAFDQFDAFQLTTAHSAARIVGSAGITLALMAGEIDANKAALIADIDDVYQLE